MALLSCAAWGANRNTVSPFLRQTGDTGQVLTADGIADFGTPYYCRIAGATHWYDFLSPTMTGNVKYYTEDFRVMALANNAEWAAWLTSDGLGASVQFAVGFVESSGGGFKMTLWSVNYPGLITPVFTQRAQGSTVLSEDTVYRLNLIANRSTNTNVEVWINGTREINYTTDISADIDNRWALWSNEKDSGKGGSMVIDHTNHIFNDEDDNGDGFTAKPASTMNVMGHHPNADITEYNEWTPDPADSHKKYYMVCDYNRTGAPGGNDELDFADTEMQGFAIADIAGGTVKGMTVFGDLTAGTIWVKLCATISGTNYGTADRDSDMGITPRGKVAALAPDGNPWTNAGFNTLQVRGERDGASGYIRNIVVEVVGTSLTRPAAEADGNSDVASICPAAPPSARRIFITHN